MRIARVIVLIFLHCWAANCLQMERKPHPCPIVPRSDGHRPGHMEQFGCQRSPLGPVREYFEAPTPRELWENHVKPYVPAVIRNALKGSPALNTWTDDKYLTENYGDQEVLVEKKYEDRKSEPKRMEIKDFLKNYAEQNWYVVTILPNAMRKDIRVPKPLMCSRFRKNLAELNLWIGTRGTRSILHYDADNIMHCVVTGLKDWMLVHPDNKPKLDMVINRSGQMSGFSHLDVDHVNEDTHPEVWDVPWQYVTLRSGDCLYLPYRYMHQVRSYNRTVSATFLWYPEGEFFDDDCEGVDYNDHLSLNNTFVYWTFENGQETVDMGYMNPDIVKNELKNVFTSFAAKRVDLPTFVYYIMSHMGDMAIEGIDTILKFFDALDKDLDGFVSIDDIDKVDMESLKDYCRGVDSPHGPTKTMLPKSDKYSAKVKEFSPRAYKQRFLDSKYARAFMSFVMRVKGTDGKLDYPTFKEHVVVRDGSIADAFILFDNDFDGVLTKDELEKTSEKRYRDFSKMYYSLKGTKISGGGKYEEDIDKGNTLYLNKLNKIPDKLLGSKEEHRESDEEDESEETADTESIETFLIGLSETIGRGLNRKSFIQAAKSGIDTEEISENIPKFDYDVFFKVLDRDGNGIITDEDVDHFIKNEPVKQAEQVDTIRPQDVLSGLFENMRKMDEIRPIVKEFVKKRNQKIQELRGSQPQPKTEL